MPSVRKEPRYEVDETTGCWNWLLGKNPKGYGRELRNGKNGYAHIHSYLDHGGTVPEGFELDHLCRNPGCINPEHLEPVPPRINNRRGKSTKLTQEKVNDIRQRYVNPSYGQRVGLMKEFGIGSTQLWRIIKKESWATQ